MIPAEKLKMLIEKHEALAARLADPQAMEKAESGLLERSGLRPLWRPRCHGLGRPGCL